MSALAATADEPGPAETPGRPRLRLADEVVTAAASAAGVKPAVMAEAVALALAGGPDKARPGWWQRAACRDRPTEEYYPARGRPLEALLERCRSCPVQPECLGAALSAGESVGVWGGTSAAARRRLRRVLRQAGILGVAGEPAYLAWLEDGADREPPPPPPRAPGRHRPRPHQLAALDAIVAALATTTGPDAGGEATRRCQIAMAPGSGKTHVGLWAAERLEARRVLVLVPNLSLVAQTAELWRHGALAVPRLLAVCSDGGSLALEATNDPGRLRSFLDGAGPGPSMSVVVATYHSSPVLVAAGRRFDLVVADEAHHLAGERDKPFAAVVRGELAADRLLYMTATPRRYTRRSGDTELVGMEDEAAFGPQAYRLSLSDAVTAGVVADYRIVVAAVEAEVFARVAAHPELGDIDPHLLAGAIAVVRAMGEFRLSSCLSFHTRVERARTFATLVGPVAEALGDERPAGPGWSGWVHGGASVRIRQRLMDRLADPATWGVLANARALGEGVDLPVLDAVAIVDPKNAESDVLQACGRALRRPGTKAKVGTVVLPVLLTGPPDPADPFAGVDEASLSVVAGVLRALRSHDGDLSSRLDAARRGLGQRLAGRPDTAALARRRAAWGLLRSRVELWVPGGATGELAGAMALRLVRESTPSWEEALGRLREWVRHHGSARVPQAATVVDGDASFGLGAWCTTQRTLHRRRLLAAEREAALEALPGWSWDPRPEQWWSQFEALAEWARIHGHPNCPQATLWQDKRIGQFLNTTRLAYKSGALSPDRVAALESLGGWSWDVRDDAWESHLGALVSWAAAHGHACPSHGDLVEGFDLGRWVSKQRVRLRAGALEPSRAQRLRAVPGWVDHEREAGWEQGYAALVSWAAAHDGAAPPQSTVTDDGYGLGSWVATQRERRRRGRLDPAREARLDVLESWEWSPRTEAWPAAYEAVAAWAARHGSARVPDGAEVEGFALGPWVVTQRMAYQRGRLEPARAAALEALPGWVWSVPQARFEAGLAALEAFVAREGHLEVRTSHREAGLPLAAWIRRVRHHHATGALSTARAAALEAVPGWSWEPGPTLAATQAADWEHNLARLVSWAGVHGHAEPRQDLVVDGVRLGAWTAKQRARYRAGTLAPERAARLEQLPAWRWRAR